MRVKITQRQFELLINNLNLIKDRRLKLSMSGDVFKEIIPNNYSINEQKLFKVHMWVGSYPVKIIFYSDNGASARIVAGKLFPKARIIAASELTGKFC